MKKLRLDILLTSVGALLIAAALALAVYNITDSMRADRSVHAALDQLYAEKPELQKRVARLDRDSALTAQDTVPAYDMQTQPLPTELDKVPQDTGAASGDYLFNPSMDMPSVMLDGDDYIGILSIPALEIVLPVMEDWDYEKLKTAPCRYSGSVYTDNMVIAAHNYKNQFGKLKNVSRGDTVTLVDMDGNEFQYEALDIEVLDASQVEDMTASDYPLTLFTCNYTGSKRIAVRCAELQ